MSEFPLLPTPAANDDGKTPEQHLAMKKAMPGGERQTITSLSVLARNGFENPGLTSSPAAPLAQTSPQLAGERECPATEPRSGSSSRERFAHFVRAASYSRTSPASSPRPVWLSTQENLLSALSWPTWPKRGTWDA